MLAGQRARFAEDYLRIRRAEGRGSPDPAYYLALPYRDVTGTLDSQWRMRGRTYRYFEKHLLGRWESEARRPLRLLDLGAGTGWMSYRLAQRGHRPVAVDLLGDAEDGLGAARHYFASLGGTFARAEAEFDRLPFPSGRFDAALFNASLHYSSDYKRTLAEAKRCLLPGGTIAVLDSPIYEQAEHGERMRRERHEQFVATYGTASDHLASIEYLAEPMLDELSRALGIRWRVHKPWYGWNWRLQPLRAKWRGARPPSRFWILEGEIISS